MASAANTQRPQRFGLIASFLVHLVLAVVLFLSQVVTMRSDEAIEIVGSVRADSNFPTPLKTFSIAPEKIEVADLVPEFTVDLVINVTAGRGGVESVGSGTGLGASEGSASGGFASLVGGFQREGLDLVIVFDGTSSMSEEILAVKERLLEIGEILIRKLPNTRIGLVAYRDMADQQPIEEIALGNDFSALQYFLDKIEAKGGGTDIREDIRIGLHHATRNMIFRDDAHKVILLFGDAPPRSFAACIRFASDFYDRLDGRISTITCGNDHEMHEFRYLAQITNGESLVLRANVDIVSELVLLIFGERHRQEAAHYLSLP